MRWFKHMTNSLDDPFIQTLIDEFGPTGYYFWFAIIEIIAKESSAKNLGELTLKSNYLCWKLRLRWTVVERLLDFCQTSGKLSANSHGDKINFSFPKIAEIKDNYTKDLQGSCKKLSKHKEVDKEKEEDKEIKREIKEKPENSRKTQVFHAENSTALISEDKNALKKETNPEIKLFLDYAFVSFQKKTGEKLLISGQKDGAIIKSLLATYPLDKLKHLWTEFLNSEDEFLKQAGYSIGVFRSQVNKLLIKPPNPDICHVCKKTLDETGSLKNTPKGAICRKCEISTM